MHVGMTLFVALGRWMDRRMIMSGQMVMSIHICM